MSKKSKNKSAIAHNESLIDISFPKKEIVEAWERLYNGIIKVEIGSGFLLLSKPDTESINGKEIDIAFAKYIIANNKLYLTKGLLSDDTNAQNVYEEVIKQLKQK